MSLDFIALFDNVAQPPAAALIEAFERSCPALDELIERHRHRWRVQAWAIGFSTIEESPEIIGPGGFVVRLSVHSVELYHCMRFSSFTHDVEMQLLMRGACRFVAELVGSSRVIYTHEMMPYGDAGLAESERALRTTIGPPAATLEMLRTCRDFGENSWFVDDFADLSARRS